MKLNIVTQILFTIAIAPIFGVVLFLGMTLVPLSVSRSWRLFMHILRNSWRWLIMAPQMLWSFMNDRNDSPIEQRMSYPLTAVVVTFGLPFIAVMVLLDDYREVC